MIIQMVQQMGLGKWSVIASHLPGRIGKQCRERWVGDLQVVGWWLARPG